MTCEPCTYSPGPEADCLPTSFSDMNQLSLLSGIDTPAKSSANEPQTDGSPTCQCGKGMSGCSIHPNTRDEWIASMRDSLASLLALPENAKALQIREERCLPKPFAVWKSSDPNMSFSKMCQDSSQASPHLAYAAGLIDGEGCIRIQKQSNKQTYIVVVQLAMSEKASVIRQALIATFGGNSYEMEFKNKKWAKQWQWRISGEKACDLLSQILPFLVLKKKQAQLALKLNEMRKKDGWTDKTRSAAEQMKQRMHELNQKGPDALNAEGGWYQPMPDLFGTWHLQSDRWPRSGMTRNGYAYELQRLELPTKETDFGFLATPTATSNQLAPSMMKHKSCRALARKLIPTTTAHDRKKCASPSEYKRNEPGIAVILGGMPHPTFQEWQMGWPIEWTGLKQLETVKSRSKQQPHGSSSEAHE